MQQKKEIVHNYLSEFLIICLQFFRTRLLTLHDSLYLNYLLISLKLEVIFIIHIDLLLLLIIKFYNVIFHLKTKKTKYFSL